MCVWCVLINTLLFLIALGSSPLMKWSSYPLIRTRCCNPRAHIIYNPPIYKYIIYIYPHLLYSGLHKELPLNNRHVTTTCSLHFSRHVRRPGTPRGTPREPLLTASWDHVGAHLPSQWSDPALCVCCSNYYDGPIRNNCASGDPVCPHTGLCGGTPPGELKFK